MFKPDELAKTNNERLSVSMNRRIREHEKGVVVLPYHTEDKISCGWRTASLYKYERHQSQEIVKVPVYP